MNTNTSSNGRAAFVVLQWLILFSLFFTSSVYACTPTDVSWMNCLPDSRYISQITIPGTHDSGALTTEHWYEPSALVVDQDLNIDQQLAIGVRFFDIRLGFGDHNSGTLWVRHGRSRQPLTGDEVFESFNRFLSDHPSETIIVSIKDEYVDKAFLPDFEFEFKNVLDRAKRVSHPIWLFDSVPTLNQARGNIVVVRRFKHLGHGLVNGLDASTGWPAGDKSQPSAIFRNFSVEDYYDAPSLIDKESVVDSHLTSAHRSTTAVMYLTFVSAWEALGGSSSYSNHLNKYLNGYFYDKKGLYGTVIVDHANIDVTRRIWETNY
jgi:1-phosphatidylinositol phosphodiesterase